MAGTRWVQKELLEKHTKGELRVYAVWFNMFPGDARAEWPPELLSDPRVIHFWDEEKKLGRYYLERHKVPHYDEALWDTWILYPAGATWEDEPPTPVSWGNTIIRTRHQLERDLKKLIDTPAAAR
ncbi:MAG TPA: hypothetical protein VNN18_04425 [Candidatus Xenobia bacterium]|nr:hypothetical protein [Candidatus Xenobia bacterium]